MGNSFYVQVSPYLLLEYTYGDSSSTYISNQVKLSRIKNAYLNGQCQLLNGSASQNVTQNVLDTSAANLGGYRWVYLDKDVPVPYINTDSNLTYTDLSGLLTSLTVTYDRVRVHIVSGYRLEDLQGLIIQVYGKEAMTQNISVLANNVYLNSDDRDILNPRPILMGDRMYDRYVEFFIPSLKGINQDFFANPTNPVSIGYQYSSDNKGFLYNSLIYVKVFEVNQLEKKNGITFMNTSDFYEVAINPQDMYSALSARIQEATDGDYFEYFPTYAGNFVEDFISDLNAAGGDYVVINDIDVYEQVGTDSLLTSSFTQVQMGNFDQPLTFRPVLKYSDTAVAFSVDYSIRVYNRNNGFQLIRRASVTSYKPRKYGKQLDRITLAQQSYPFRVYNKVYGNSPVTFIGNEYAPTFSTVYIPVFYETRNIVVQSKTLLANGSNPVDTNFYKAINFGQGDARIYISDFDSYIKFTISQVSAKNGAVSAIDLSAGNVSIAFKDSAGNMIKIPAESSDDENMKSDGEVVFRIPSTLKAKVLYSDSPAHFYIVSESDGTPETLLYTGTVDDVKNVSKEPARAKEVLTTAQSAALSETATTTTSTPKTVSGSQTSGGLQATLNSSANSSPKSLLQSLTEANSLAVDSIKSTPEVKPAVIPNFSFDTGAASVKTGITPVTNTSTSKAEAQVNTKLSQSTSSTTNITSNK